MPIYLIVGLGNPGQRYLLNRHNIGFILLDFIAHALDFPPYKDKFNAHLSEKELDGVGRIILLKPQTFMNLSGKSVSSICQFYKIPMEQVYVIHDDLDLLPSQLRIKKGGGAGGHNGLKSIDACSGPNYWRIRVGIGRPLNPLEDIANYVLSNFSHEDLDGWVTSTMQAVGKFLPSLFITKDPQVWLKQVVDYRQSLLNLKSS